MKNGPTDGWYLEKLVSRDTRRVSPCFQLQPDAGLARSFRQVSAAPPAGSPERTTTHGDLLRVRPLPLLIDPRVGLQIAWGACALVLTGNIVIFGTILGFFLVFGSNDDFSWQQW